VTAMRHYVNGLRFDLASALGRDGAGIHPTSPDRYGGQFRCSWLLWTSMHHAMPNCGKWIISAAFLEPIH